jgi:nicotinate-nucleotide adenylyltransferase
VKIAIFGGSFDPVHIGHQTIVKEAIKSLDIDKLLVVPTYLNPFKSKYHLEPKIRLELLEKVFKNLSQIEVSDYEITQGKAVYSIQTVKYYKNLYNTDKIYLIIGEDNLKSLDEWFGIEELQSLVEIVVARRSAHKEEKTLNYKTLCLDINISSSELRDTLDLKYIPNEIKNDILSFNKENKGLNS